MDEMNYQRKRRPTLWQTPFVTQDSEGAKHAFVRHVQASLGRDEFSASAWDRYQALCLSVREHLISRWIHTQQTYYHNKARRVYYLSMEFLLGRALRNALLNLGIYETYQRALRDLGLDFDELEEEGVEPGLGNGGLGRLAACFLDSMATLGLPAYGFGLRYDYGIFRQRFVEGRQVEEPDDWLRLPNPWEIPRPETRVRVKFGGRVQVYADTDGRLRHSWVDTEDVEAMAYDTPVPGFGNNTVNTLRLWGARGTENFDFGDFNVGDYVGAVEHKVLAENITKVLYPNDNVYSGKELRFKQQYFLVAATMQDAIRRHLVMFPRLDNLAEQVVFQLNDTHPALAVPELLRILIDDHGMEWEQAWELTGKTMAYTNHTLLPEALEKWPVDLFNRLLPRHVQLINEINGRLLQTVKERFPDDAQLVRRLSIYEEGAVKRVRMAHLAVAGSFSVNGVAELHTELLKSRVMPDFHRIWPEKFNSKTNGVTQRRWLLGCNPPLAELISSRIGDGWITALEQLRRLEEEVDDELLERIGAVKKQAKARLAQVVSRQFGVKLNPESIFDIQIKRIHEYKRQLLNALHIIHLYLQIKRDPSAIRTPRTFMFGGKAAPGYSMAKLHIKLINDIAERINADPQASSLIKVFFFPNYNVTAAELLFPAADVSEQISTAGFEASGTGNMKFALNGALTIGTLDGANVEIARAVGDENIFIFGHTVDEVARLRRDGYDPSTIYRDHPPVAEILDLLAGDFFSPEETGLYQPIIDSLLHKDFYLLLADFHSYREAQQRVDVAYANQRRWNRMALANIARVGKFSSDRTIRAYNDEIWGLSSFKIEV